MKKNSLLLLFLLAVGINVMADDCVPVTTYPATAEFSFTPFVPEGALVGQFSINSTQKVLFSKGNLQYCAAPTSEPTTHAVAGGGSAQGIWRFAEHQYDMIGANNWNGSETYTGWIDLFGFGCSGYNNGYACYQPWKPSSSTDASSSKFIQYSLGGDNANSDWGVYNAISNGGDEPSLWRTLTQEEWDYILTQRTNASDKYGLALVCSVEGLVLLPDEWETPATCTFTAGKGSYNLNTYDQTQWAKMETAGAVFLPAAGNKHGDSGVTAVGSIGYYYSSTHQVQSKGDSYLLQFQTTDISASVSMWSDNGHSVRLVYVK